MWWCMVVRTVQAGRRSCSHKDMHACVSVTLPWIHTCAGEAKRAAEAAAEAAATAAAEVAAAAAQTGTRPAAAAATATAAAAAAVGGGSQPAVQTVTVEPTAAAVPAATAAAAAAAAAAEAAGDAQARAATSCLWLAAGLGVVQAVALLSGAHWLVGTWGVSAASKVGASVWHGWGTGEGPVQAIVYSGYVFGKAQGEGYW